MIKVNDMIVTIVVPVYNAEKYLNTCIESILNQTYSNIELILVNDGSLDNSGLICDKFANRDHRVKVIHQKNSGPSVARNKGINIAKGKYIQFVDSDDFLEPNTTATLVSSMDKDVELVICAYRSKLLVGKKIKLQSHTPPYIGEFDKVKFLKSFGKFSKYGFINPIWNKLYDISVLRQHNIRFINELSMGEDLIFNLEYLRVCKNVKVINDELYNYIILNNEDSLTDRYIKDLYKNQKMLNREVKEFLIEFNSFNNENQKIWGNICVKSTINCFNNIFHSNNTQARKQKIYEIKNIISDEFLRENIGYFKKGSFQNQLVGYFIEHQLINIIYLCFEFRGFIKKKAQSIYYLFKVLDKSLSKNS